jgi:hypothetical protein
VELAQIRYFVMLCDERNFSRAARRCGVSQPSLSIGIKNLEHELGGKLFERSGMSLTPLGKSVRPQFENALASIGQIAKRATAFHRRQAARRPGAARRILRLDTAVPLNGAKPFEQAPQSEAADKRDSREDHADQHIVGHGDRKPQQSENRHLR